jgi:hypothetical protein
LQMGSCFLSRPTWITNLLFYASPHHWYDRSGPPCQAFFPLWWGLANFFCSGWPRTVILPILASHIVWSDRHMPPHAYLLVVVESLKLFTWAGFKPWSSQS